MNAYRRGPLIFDVVDRGPADGTPVVLLHGFPETSASWDLVAPELAAAGYRVLAPDQRGYSPRARPGGRGAYRSTELVRDVLALADSAGAGAFHVVGHDFGAAVAWVLAMRSPERLLTMTALSVPHPAAFRRAAFSGPQGLRSWYMAFFQLPWLPEAMLTAQSWRSFERNLERSGLPQQFAERYVTHLREPGALTAALNWYRGLRPLADARATKVAVPTLLMWGTRDAYVHETGIHLTERYMSGPYRLAVLDGVNHWIPETAAEQVVELLLPHLAAGEPAAV
ncbi:MAG: alpha/beta fold hydrolase [Candidatus Dormibacteraeota bacterium]|nr:alpha/beta fold hydrolase [Candidatus Dormibacteraeota bacterium]MBV9524661.1 alpha/beta fold hydrolase [Candidatus Dormibacteraeota bacterium]